MEVFDGLREEVIEWEVGGVECWVWIKSSGVG